VIIIAAAITPALELLDDSEVVTDGVT